MKKKWKLIFIIIIIILQTSTITYAENSDLEEKNTKSSSNIESQELNLQKKSKANGIYKLAVGKDVSKTIGVRGGSEYNNAAVEIWNYVNVSQQKFYLEYNEEGFYKITAMHTGKSLTVKDNNIEDGAEIVQYDYQELDSQKWTLRDSHKNGWIISPLSSSNLAVSVNKTIENGSKLILHTNEDNDNQMYYMFNISKEEQSKPNGIFKLTVGKDANKTIGVRGGSEYNNAAVEIWNYVNVSQQKFYLEYNEEGFYKITAMHTGKSLTVKNNSINDGSDIVQYEYQGLSSQKWILRDSHKNGWIISPLNNPNLAITIENKIQNGERLLLSKIQNLDNQMYYMFNISKEEQLKKDGTYKLAVGRDASKVIEVKGSNNSNNAIIDIWNYGNVPAQKFYFEYDEEGFYKITATHTEKSLTVRDNKIEEGTDIVQYEYKGLSSQKWILKDSKKNGWVISPLNYPKLAISIENTIKDGERIVLSKTQDNDNQMFYILNLDQYNININNSKYPGYKEKLENLKQLHPNWNFELLYTGLKFEDVTAGECKVHSRNLVSSSYSGEWVCPVCGTKLYDSGLYCASEKAVAHYMDPRNFLDETNIFQFEKLNMYEKSIHTLEGIKLKTNGTFLNNYAEDIKNACINKNVNPYYIVARLIQEQGRNGTTIGKGMDGGDGRTYYNPFNIGASGNGYSQIYNNALKTAKSYGWDTMQKALEGGIDFCKRNWLENYQNTLYQNKFDIDTRNGSSLYTHQYMQNLFGAYSEAKTLRSMYAETNCLDGYFTFIIPVYENMSDTEYPLPSNSTESNSLNVIVRSNGGVNLRSDANTSSRVIEVIPNGTMVLSVQRGIGDNWNKVITKDGKIGFMSGNYLEITETIKNCNYNARVKTNDGSGCKVRIGPSINLDRFTTLSENTEVTVIEKGTFNNIDGYDWCRVIIPDGRHGYMPSKFLK